MKTQKPFMCSSTKYHFLLFIFYKFLDTKPYLCVHILQSNPRFTFSFLLFSDLTGFFLRRQDYIIWLMMGISRRPFYHFLWEFSKKMNSVYSFWSYMRANSSIFCEPYVNQTRKCSLCLLYHTPNVRLILHE